MTRSHLCWWKFSGSLFINLFGIYFLRSLVDWKALQSCSYSSMKLIMHTMELWKYLIFLLFLFYKFQHLLQIVQIAFNSLYNFKLPMECQVEKWTEVCTALLHYFHCTEGICCIIRLFCYFSCNSDKTEELVIAQDHFSISG